MWNPFKRKSELERLQEQYTRLSEQSFKFSRVNRRESDQKAAEAELARATELFQAYSTARERYAQAIAAAEATAGASAEALAQREAAQFA